MNYLNNLIIFLSFYTILIKAQHGKNICESKTNCEECIGNKDCLWCINEVCLSFEFFSEQKMLQIIFYYNQI